MGKIIKYYEDENVLIGDTTGLVPTSRTLTINGTTYDLSANRNWNISGLDTGIEQYIVSDLTVNPITIVDTTKTILITTDNLNITGDLTITLDGLLSGQNVIIANSTDTFLLTINGMLIYSGHTSSYKYDSVLASLIFISNTINDLNNISKTIAIALTNVSGINTGDETEASINSKILKDVGTLSASDNIITFVNHKSYYNTNMMGGPFTIEVNTNPTDNFEFVIETGLVFYPSIDINLNSVLYGTLLNGYIYHCKVINGQLSYPEFYKKISFSTDGSGKNLFLDYTGAFHNIHRNTIQLPDNTYSVGGDGSSSGMLSGIIGSRNVVGIGQFSNLSLSGKILVKSGVTQIIDATSLSATATEELGCAGTTDKFIAIYDGTDTKIYENYSGDISNPLNWNLIGTLTGVKYRLIGKASYTYDLYFIDVGTPSKNVYVINGSTGLITSTITFNSIPNAIDINSCASSFFSNQGITKTLFCLTDTTSNTLYIRDELDNDATPTNTGSYAIMGTEKLVFFNNELFISQGDIYSLEYLF